MVLVCRPFSLHSVGPWRTSRTSDARDVSDTVCRGMASKTQFVEVGRLALPVFADDYVQVEVGAVA